MTKKLSIIIALIVGCGSADIDEETRIYNQLQDACTEACAETDRPDICHNQCMSYGCDGVCINRDLLCFCSPEHCEAICEGLPESCVTDCQAAI